MSEWDWGKITAGICLLVLIFVDWRSRRKW